MTPKIEQGVKQELTTEVPQSSSNLTMSKIGKGSPKKGWKAVRKGETGQESPGKGQDRTWKPRKVGQ